MHLCINWIIAFFLLATSDLNIRCEDEPKSAILLERYVPLISFPRRAGNATSKFLLPLGEIPPSPANRPRRSHSLANQPRCSSLVLPVKPPNMTLYIGTDMIIATSPFLLRVPQEKREEFIQDCTALAAKLLPNNGGVDFKFSYNTIMVQATRRPESDKRLDKTADDPYHQW